MWLLILVLSAVSYARAQAWGDSAVYYRIIVDSFKDGDGDGLGDLQGATKQISYVRALGADAVILSPISERSTDCSQPGIVDFTEIDSRYGNLDGLNALLTKTKKLELKVVITLPLQTVSALSEWFKSSADRVPGFEDRILWMNGNADEPPKDNDYSWKWHEGRSAYFASTNNEAVLNLCSESVAAALAAAQCAWLKRGVAGFLLTPDFPRDNLCGEKLLKKMVAEAISCARAANFEIPVILAETSHPPDIAANYYSGYGIGANSVLSRALTLSTRSSASKLALGFHADMLHAPDDMTPTWVTSVSNESRTATRYGGNMVDAINVLALTLPGAAIIQQGDELGTADTILEWATSTNCWPMAAVQSAAPFPWDDSVNGGFSAGEPWLPPAPNYRYANAKTEFANDLSHVGVLRVAAVMRKSPAIGPHAEVRRIGEAISVLRWGGSGSLLVISNVAQDQTEAQLSKIPGLPAEMTVAASSAGSSLSQGSHVNTEKRLKLTPGETILLVGPPRHCGGPGPVDKIASKLNEGWQKLNKYFSNA